ncbi:mitochondrial ribosomal protein S16 [Plectosphaerella cucumerina]|uniref:Mitochondrial ribosomal protein S16 n=1 Tax=Plectosphaerella cucumerina TaxID=40658 RepID=A0A8K0TUF2_9PEZI|nr:mitochondrial ribosomal protein S16 [Plectosphaerella cucumerina]
MVLRMRLARFGRRNAPFYNIVVSHARTARNSKPLEVLGTYDPIPKLDPYDEDRKPHKDIQIDILRAKYWIGVGVQPSDPVWRLLSMVGLLEPKYGPDGIKTKATAAASLRARENANPANPVTQKA